MAKDTIGNNLEKGNLVQIQLSAPNITGRIVSIQEGGLVDVRGGRGAPQAQVTMGAVKVQIELDVNFDPRSGFVPGLIRAHDPMAEEQPAPPDSAKAN